jgi:chorismate dehydratase
LAKKIKVGAVSYLNAKPLIWGMKNGDLNDLMELQIAYPALLAKKLLANEIDIALVPIAVLPQMPQYYLPSPYGIGCNGSVESVCLYSQVPIEEITHVYLDYQSRTSVQLVKILLKNYWKKEVSFLDADTNYISKIENTTAGLIIGDRAFASKKIFKYEYDLGAAWKDFTGYPFVFATWVSPNSIEESFLAAFNESQSKSLKNMKNIAAALSQPGINLEDYYTNKINYTLSDAHWQGMKMFLTFING